MRLLLLFLLLLSTPSFGQAKKVLEGNVRSNSVTVPSGTLSFTTTDSDPITNATSVARFTNTSTSATAFSVLDFSTDEGVGGNRRGRIIFQKDGTNGGKLTFAVRDTGGSTFTDALSITNAGSTTIGPTNFTGGHLFYGQTFDLISPTAGGSSNLRLNPYGASNNAYIESQILAGDDSGASPVMQFDVRRSNGAAISTRPLFSWTNFNATTVGSVSSIGAWSVGPGSWSTVTPLLTLNSGSTGTGNYNWIRIGSNAASQPITIGDRYSAGGLLLQVNSEGKGTPGADNYGQINTGQTTSAITSSGGLPFAVYRAPAGQPTGTFTSFFGTPIMEMRYDGWFRVRNNTGAGSLTPLASSCTGGGGTTTFDTGINQFIGMFFLTTPTSVAMYSKIGAGSPTLLAGTIAAGWSVATVTGTQTNSAIQVTNNNATTSCLITFLNHY